MHEKARGKSPMNGCVQTAEQWNYGSIGMVKLSLKGTDDERCGKWYCRVGLTVAITPCAVLKCGKLSDRQGVRGAGWLFRWVVRCVDIQIVFH